MRAALACLLGRQAFVEYALGGIGVFVEPELQVLAEYGGYDALHFRVAELLFGLSLELGVGQLD